MRWICTAFAVAAITSSGSGAFSEPGAEFRPPTVRERQAAVGSTRGLSPILERAFSPGSLFEALGQAKAGEWLASHSETGQTFEQFARQKRNVPEDRRDKIYLLPIGEFKGKKSPPLSVLKEYAARFFQLEVVSLPARELKGLPVAIREHSFAGRQLLTRDILEYLREKLPADAFCLLALTMEDLYPDERWNFVFGQASLKGRVGVYSFARYDPAAYGKKRGADHPQLLLRRSVKTMTHELGHMFGVKHCIYFKCLMNGSNHLKEADSRPLFLCPVCLRKLHESVGFDVQKRYAAMQKLLSQAKLTEEASWLAERLAYLEGT